jgi:tetratricopeptide (TPR) repeat protein
MVIAERCLRTIPASEIPGAPAHGDLLWALAFADAAFAAAEDSYEKCLDVMERCLGADHPGTARMHRALADVEEAMGRPAEAERHLRRALAVHMGASGSSHLDVASDLIALAKHLLTHERQPEAMPLLHRAASAYEAVLGPDAGEVAALRRTLDELQTVT